MTAELDKARLGLASFFGALCEDVVNYDMRPVDAIEALIRAILAEQDGSKDQAVADAIVKVAEIVARAVSEGKAPDSDQNEGWHECGATEALRAALADKEKAERERDAALKWHKIAMEQVAVRGQQVEKAERERDEARAEVGLTEWMERASEAEERARRYGFNAAMAKAELAALRDIFIWIEDGPGLECIPNNDIQEAIHKAIPNIKALAQERRAARQSRNEEGGGSDNSRADSGPDIAQPARDGDEPPASATPRAEAGLSEAIIEGGNIVIRVPIDVLPIAFKYWPGAPRNNNGEPRYVVTDAATFAKGVVHYLNDEKEDGTTRIHRMLDDAMNEALEQGEEGVEEIANEAITAARNAGIKRSADDVT
jgi:hypothetical protein